MAKGPKITRVEVHEFEYEKEDTVPAEDGVGIMYKPGAKMSRTGFALRILTDTGPVGEFVGGAPLTTRPYPHSSTTLSATTLCSGS